MKLLVFSTPETCGPCRRQEPILERLKKEGVEIETFDKDQRDEFAKNAISSVPTILFTNNGEIVFRNVGFMTEMEITSKINEILLTK